MSRSLETARGTVHRWQCDHMGHVNVRAYGEFFEEACWQYYAMIGIRPSRLRSGEIHMAAVQQDTSYRRELLGGDVVMVRTGRMSTWPDAEKFMAPSPGINVEGAKFLAESGAIIVGADNLVLEHMPSVVEDNWVPVHTYLLVEAGVPIMEVVDTEELSQESLYEFAFVGAAMPLRGATAAPMRPIALPLLER